MFGLATVGYLFLGGIGGGLCLVGGVVGVLQLSTKVTLRQRRVAGKVVSKVFVVALVALLSGALLLLTDVGNYRALTNLFFPPKPSILFFGAWMIALASLLSFTLLLLWQKEPVGRWRVLLRAAHFVASIFGFAVALYTGVYLATMPAVPFWNTALVPLLFTLSSLSCGLVFLIAVVEIFNTCHDFKMLASVAAQCEIVTLVLELITAFVLVGCSLIAPRSGSYAIAEQSAWTVIVGSNAWLWWGVFIGLGIFGSLLFEVLVLRGAGNASGRFWNTLAPVFCVLCGAFAMRYCIVAAGMHPILEF